MSGTKWASTCGQGVLSARRPACGLKTTQMCEGFEPSTAAGSERRLKLAKAKFRDRSNARAPVFPQQLKALGSQPR